MSKKYINNFRDSFDIHEDYSYDLLDWNEGQSLCVDGLKDHLIETIIHKQLNLYPNVSCLGLTESLMSCNGLSNKKILLYNGSDSALRDILITFLDREDKITIVGPTYTQINCFIDIVKASPKILIPENIFSPNFEQMSHEFGESKIVYINNPNNPTGVLVPRKTITKLAENFKDTTFIIDEAYIDFCPNESLANDMTPDNIIVTRSFSKAMGIAGLRLGYCVCGKKNYDRLSNIHNPKSVNTIAQEAGKYIIKNMDRVRYYINNVIHNRNSLYKKLQSLGVECHNSQGNFVLLKHQKSEEIIQHMMDNKIVLRDRSSLPKMKNYIRISIGNNSQIDKLISILKEVI